MMTREEAVEQIVRWLKDYDDPDIVLSLLRNNGWSLERTPWGRAWDSGQPQGPKP